MAKASYDDLERRVAMLEGTLKEMLRILSVVDADGVSVVEITGQNGVHWVRILKKAKQLVGVKS